ncbi:UV excision repair protein RAD23 B [Nowakowskiella sp. JEL0407]|nr:UV excision repair protein RAD23 B [Nowakowskiella sp. JEL0407]
MVTKPKAATASTSSSSTTKTTSTPTSTTPSTTTSAPPPVPAPLPEANPTTITPTPTTQAPPTTAFDASTLATGNAFESAVANLVEMGFERSEVVRAMRAAFNNPDRAAEYLMTGIPENVARELAPQTPQRTGTTPTTQTAQPTTTQPSSEGGYVNLFEQAAQQQANQRAGNTGQTGGGAGGAAAQLAGLRSSPQFQQLRQLVQAQPHLLEPMLQSLAASNPQLLQLINTNQEAFLQLLNEGDDGDDAVAADALAALGGGGQTVIQITPEENEAVQRLVALGFDRDAAVVAYLTCDKNEELAANYLFESQNDEEWHVPAPSSDTILVTALKSAKEKIISYYDRNSFEDCIEAAKTQLRDADDSYESHSNLNSSQKKSANNNVNNAFSDFFLFTYGNGTDEDDEFEDEIERYFKEPCDIDKEREFDLLGFWKDRQVQKKYPVLSVIAKDYLAAQASSAPCEELFSSGVDLVVPNRSRLSDKSITKVMSLKYWMKQREGKKWTRWIPHKLDPDEK